MKLEASRILITGGGGFLGGALVRRLTSSGYTVRSFSRGSYIWLRNLGVEQMRGDLDDADAVDQACKGCDLVFHVAARAGIWGDRDHYYRTNVVGTRHVLNSCRKQGVRRLVYTSSPSVVLRGEDIEGGDESLPYADSYLAPYPATKAEAEKAVLAANDAELATVALRPHLIWGPDDPHIVSGFIKRARKGQLKKVGSSGNRVDFTYVDNAAQAHVLAAERLAPGSPIAGRAFFISDGRPVALWDFVNDILKSADLPPVKTTVSPRFAYRVGALLESLYRLFRLRGEPRMTRFLARELSTAHWFDISAARRELDYDPEVEVEEGLRRLAAHLRQPGKNKAKPSR